MVVLGLILVLAAVVGGVVVVVDNSGHDHMTTFSAFGGEWHVQTFWIAVIGAAVLVVAVLGLSLIRGGGRRGLRRRQERRELERENAALSDRVRHDGPVAPPGAPTAYDPDTGPSYQPAPPAYDDEPRRPTP